MKLVVHLREAQITERRGLPPDPSIQDLTDAVQAF